MEDRDISIEYNSSVNYTKITPSIQVMKLDGTLQATFAESGMVK